MSDDEEEKKFYNVGSRRSDTKRKETEESFKRCQSVEVLTSETTKKLDHRRNIDAVLDSLANDNVVVDGDSNPRNHRGNQRHRRSVPLLFGVQVRELPAPDTVRETRRLFEPAQRPTAATSKMNGLEKIGVGAGNRSFEEKKISARPSIPSRPGDKVTKLFTPVIYECT